MKSLLMGALHPHFKRIIDAVKGDLKKEHLKKNPELLTRYFRGIRADKLGANELAPFYDLLLKSGNDNLEEFIIHRWIAHHNPIYLFFAEELGRHYSDFAAIKEIDEPVAQKLITDGVERFGAIDLYLFSMMNGVVFSKDQFEELRLLAQGNKTPCHESHE